MTGKGLRIVFMGTPDFAVESLNALVEGGYNIVGVITAPDKPAGRGMQLNEPAVKKYAQSKGLLVFQPEKLKNPGFQEELRQLNADLQIVVAFRMLPEAVWAMPPLGTFNLHASLLPHYRGAAPINWAVINGETKTGVTTFLLDHEIDTGKILFTAETEIGETDTAGDLHDRLMCIGANLVLKTTEAIASGGINPLPQEQLVEGQKIRHAPKIFKDDCRIQWDNPAEKTRNLIRGLSPYPSAWSNIRKKDSPDENEILVKIYSARKTNTQPEGTPGTILTDNETYIKVACSDFWLELEDIQMAGKKRMKIKDFLNGFRDISGYYFK